MIIDDQVQALNSLKSALEVRGFNCVAFSDPLLAVSSYNPEVYDLVITDINMPEMNGLEVKESILQKNPHARVILITGDLERLAREVRQQIDPQFLLTKPLDRNTLSNTLQNIKTEVTNKNFQDTKDNQAENSL